MTEQIKYRIAIQRYDSLGRPCEFANIMIDSGYETKQLKDNIKKHLRTMFKVIVR